MQRKSKESFLRSKLASTSAICRKTHRMSVRSCAAEARTRREKPMNFFLLIRHTPEKREVVIVYNFYNKQGVVNESVFGFVFQQASDIRIA